MEPPSATSRPAAKAASSASGAGDDHSPPATLTKGPGKGGLKGGVKLGGGARVGVTWSPKTKPSASSKEASLGGAGGAPAPAPLDDAEATEALLTSAAAATSASGGAPSALPALLSLLTLVLIPIVANVLALASPKHLGPLMGFRMAPSGGGLTPPACLLGGPKPLVRGHLPTFVFVAGVAGSGHEFLETAFELLKERTNMTLEREDNHLLLTAEDGQVADASKQAAKKFRKCPKLPYARQVYDFGAEITARLASLQDAPGVPFRGTYVRTKDTIPMGNIHTPLARPDLVSLGMFHGILYSLKVIVLVRDPARVLESRVQRGKYGRDLGLAVRETEDSLAYLDVATRQLPCGAYVALNMGALMDDRQLAAPAGAPAAAAAGQLALVADELASFLEIPNVGPTQVLQVLSQARSLLLMPKTQRRAGGTPAATKSTVAGALGGQAAKKGKGGGGRRLRRRLLAAAGSASTAPGGGPYSDKPGRHSDTSNGTGTGSGSDILESLLAGGKMDSWEDVLGDKASPRHLLWPLLSALQDVPVYRPLRPSQWPGL